MRSAQSTAPGRSRPSQLVGVVRALILVLPATLLLVASFRVREPRTQQLLWAGAGAQGLFFLGCVVAGRLARRLSSPTVIALYGLALAWLWVTQSIVDDWFSPLAQFLLLAVPLGAFAMHSLDNTGAIAARRANILALRLAQRKDWPADLADCQTLPDVKAFREALAVDATPALNLLQNPRPQVRIAALAALEFRQHWAPDQAQVVLRFARQTKEPLVRAAAVTALGNLQDRAMLEAVAEFLRDPAPEVRQATADVLFWDSALRWGWVQHTVHQALADPAHLGDGPLVWDGQDLPEEAVNDLLAWCAEKGPISVRAAQTLGAYFQRRLTSTADDGLIQSIQEQVANGQTPPTLRMELAQLLRTLDALDRPMQERLLEATNPAPLRLLAAECLLATGRGEPYPPAVAALRDIARMPNREMALTTADVVQRRLGVDLGLAVGQPLPPVHSRQAADVMRRLMQWATGPEDGATHFSTIDTKLDRAAKRASGPLKLPPKLR